MTSRGRISQLCFQLHSRVLFWLYLELLHFVFTDGGSRDQGPFGRWRKSALLFRRAESLGPGAFRPHFFTLYGIILDQAVSGELMARLAP